MSLRIVLLPSSYFPDVGGVQEICRNLSTHLIARGYKVCIITNRYPSDLPDFQVIYGVEVFRFDFHSPTRNLHGLLSVTRVIRTLVLLLKHFRRWRPDLIHVICPSSSALYLRLLSGCGSWKTIVTFQGELFMDANQIYQRSAFARWALGQLLADCSGITSCSKFVFEDAAARYPRVARHNSIIFNGVEAEEIAQPLLQTRENLYIFAMGRLVRNKGFDVLLSAFKLLLEAHSDVQLVIAGEGSDRARLQILTEQLGIETRVTFVGWRNRGEITSLLDNCSVFVMPSPVEPFGIVCLEAMRAGKALVATCAGGPPEFLQHGRNALLVLPNDPQQMAAAVSSLLLSKELREQMEKNNSKDVHQFHWDKITSEYERVYHKIMEAP